MKAAAGFRAHFKSILRTVQPEGIFCLHGERTNICVGPVELVSERAPQG